MGDQWFEIASLDHFWIRRRFQVLRRLAREIEWNELEVAEIGCGNGLLQKQCEDMLGISVDGFDLNAHALAQNQATRSRVCCYNIYDQRPELQRRYDVIFLFDVIEHIEDQVSFLRAALFHLKSGGRLVINVPADPSVYSSYDLAVGHVRRYGMRELKAVLAQVGLTTNRWTYWGLLLYPLLHIRKRRLAHATDAEQILRDGMKPPSALANEALGWLSQAEIIPQHWLGSSLMVIAGEEVGCLI